MTSEEVDVLREQYRSAAERTVGAPAPVINRWVAEVERCYKFLKNTDEGRNALLSLLEDSHPQVRIWAARHCLQWDPVRARDVLEELVRKNEAMYGFTAKYTLKEFDKGRLRF